MAKNLVYPAYQLVTGRRVLSKLGQFEDSQWLSSDEIEGLQKERLMNLLIHAQKHVPFYKKRIEKLGDRPQDLVEAEAFRQLPELTKDDIQIYGKQLVASNYSLSQLRQNATGGSTGQTLSFYNDSSSLDFRSAVTIRGDRWAGLDIGTAHARLWGAPLDISAQEKFVNRWSNRLLNRLWLDCFRLSENLLADYVKQIRDFRPRVLIGYATALTTLADYIVANNIKDIRLHSIISSAETLYPEQRQRIESTFNCKIYDRYGCREAGPTIVECESGQMHVSADYVYVEILRDGLPAQPGEIGEIVITPFFSYGMPLIRYKIGDLGVAVEQSPCNCGRDLPIVGRIMGRTSDMMVNAQGELFHGEYFTHLFYNQSGIRRFQVIQPDPQHLIFKVVSDQDLSPELFRDFETKILDFVGMIDIKWDLVDEIPPLESGKQRFTISHVPIRFKA